MNSRLRWLVLATLVAVLSIATSATALEKVAERWDGSQPADEWRAAGTCSLAYYNLCAGYIWVWSGWAAGDRLGTAFTTCCEAGETANLLEFYFYFRTGSPAGYGFTGSMNVYPVDASLCPTGSSLLTQAHLPATGWNYVDLAPGIQVPSDFALFYEEDPGLAYPSVFTLASDMPFLDSGTCYPTTRAARSFFWRSAASPLCPGSTFFDGVADAEILTSTLVECVVSVDPSSWGDIKALYR